MLRTGVECLARSHAALQWGGVPQHSPPLAVCSKGGWEAGTGRADELPAADAIDLKVLL